MPLQPHQLAHIRLHGEPPPPPLVRHKRNNEESRIQKSCRRWWDSVCANHGLDAGALYAVPNGATLGDKYTASIRGSILRDEGLRAKYPDLNFDVMRRGFGGLRIEMKRPGEEPDAGQLEYHALIRARGYRVEVCHSLKAFMLLICGYLKS